MAHFPVPSPKQQKKFSLKKFLFFFPKKTFFLYFGMELSSPKPKKCNIVFQKKISYLSGWNVQVSSPKKKTSLKNFFIFFQKDFFSYILG